MAELTKPGTLNTIWAEGGDKIKPEDSKIQLGWLAEIPPRQFFNYMDNRRDQAIAHINQRGIAEWDVLTEYQALKSYTQGRNGVIYRAKVTNTGKDPMTDSGSWEEAFASIDSSGARLAFIGYSVQSSSFAALANSRYYVATPLIVTLPATAPIGSVITLAKKPNVVPSVVVSGGGVITTVVGSDTTITFDIEDEINFIFNGLNWEV